MAGPWLKIECSTPDKPQVLAITSTMGWDDPDLTVGKLFKLWRWFDQHTVDGNARSVTAALLDRYVGATGFVSAVASVGWLCVSEAGISLVNFDDHNGETAKKRAQTAKRVAEHKARFIEETQQEQAGNGEGNASSVSGALPRGRGRGRSNTPPTPKGECEGFAEFWKAYPRKIGKAEAEKAFAKLRPTAEQVQTLLAALAKQSQSPQWKRDGGQYIPHASTWLNQRRWEDEDGVAAPAGDVFAGAM